MNFILSLGEIDKSLHKPGNKAVYLSDLAKSDFPIPTAFVLTKDAFLLHLKSNQLEERIKPYILDFENKEHHDKIIQLVAETDLPFSVKTAIKEAYDDLSFGKEANVTKQALEIIRSGRSRIYVAVRPSVSDTKNNIHGYINIIGLEKLLEIIKRSWASIYLESLETKQNLDFSIIVQKMVDPEKSGFLFTKDPTNSEQTFIEATWASSQAISLGLVNPDVYILNQTGELLGKKITKKSVVLKRDQIGKVIAEIPSAERVGIQVITDQEVSKLSEYSKKIEDRFGCPQEVEWCIDRGRLFILKTQPIKLRDLVIENQFYGEPLLSGISASPGVVKGKVKIVNSQDDLEKLNQGDILVCKTPNSQLIPYIEKASALLTEDGGLSSYAAAASRNMGIPCIVGMDSLIKSLNQDQEITVDAVLGKIYLNEAPQPILVEESLDDTKEEALATEIKINLSVLENLESLSGFDGAVLSLDSVLTNQNINPTSLSKENPTELTSLLSENIRKVAHAAGQKTVLYKPLDMKLSSDQQTELNPILGLRGVRGSLNHPEVLECELNAIKSLQENGLTNTCFIIPFITTVEELRQVKRLITFPLKLGISIEIPSSAIEMENFCKDGIDFVSIDLSVLTQLTLGVDKQNSQISNLYLESHPSVLFLLKHVVSTCKKHGVKTNIVIGSQTKQDLVEKFIEIGIDSISTCFDSTNLVKKTALKKEKQMLLDKARLDQTI